MRVFERVIFGCLRGCFGVLVRCGVSSLRLGGGVLFGSFSQGWRG